MFLDNPNDLRLQCEGGEIACPNKLNFWGKEVKYLRDFKFKFKDGYAISPNS